MKSATSELSARYQLALGSYVTGGAHANLKPARTLGGEFLAAGVTPANLAALHEATVVTGLLPRCPARGRGALIRRAGAFFAAASNPGGGSAKRAPLEAVAARLSGRAVELLAANAALALEAVGHQAAKDAFNKREAHFARVLKQSDVLQDQLRRLSRQILAAQEEERKAISRELHDIVAQMLTGINIRLATLKKEAAKDARSLARAIARTQRLVQRSVDVVHRFARELRPAVLDDLGLIPALHSFLKHFTARTGVRTSLTAFAGVEALSMARRTVLFRVAQEALTNVARHAEASRVDVRILKAAEGGVCMKIHDDGKSFQSQDVLLARGRGRRLGLLGMRERLEMVGGSLAIESAPGEGTLILARIPGGKTGAARPDRPPSGRATSTP